MKSFFLIILLCSMSQLASSHKPERYSATIQPHGGIERYSYLEVVNFPIEGPPIRKSVAEVFLPVVEAGDILLVEGMIEATNQEGYATEFTCKVIYSGSTGSINGTIVMPEKGYNISPQETPEGHVFHGNHHGLFPFSATFSLSNSMRVSR